MFIDLNVLAGPERYKLLTAAIVPRPIAWIVSRGEQGATNVAPFSFFNLMSGDPPLICVGIGMRDGAPKDTARNIAERGEFTVNLVSTRLAARMNVTAVDFPAGVDESQEAGLVLAPSERIGFHTHVLDYFWTAVTGGKARSCYGDGRVAETAYKPGDTQHHHFEAGQFMIHDLENIGTTDLVFTTVEFKDSANAPLTV